MPSAIYCHTQSQAIARHAAACELCTASRDLEHALSLAPGEGREERLRTLSSALKQHAERESAAATPGFADAVTSDLLRRFWHKEYIGVSERANLREALDAYSRIDPLEYEPQPPTYRRVLIEERDAVLAQALRRQPGERVVGVVGKVHVSGSCSTSLQCTAYAGMQPIQHVCMHFLTQV